MEALILYFVLFFPGVNAWSAIISLAPGVVGGAEAIRTIPFSIIRELGRTITHSLPGIALLLYLISGKSSDKVSAVPPGDKSFRLLKATIPAKRDIIPFVIGLPVLIIIGLFVSFLASLFARLYGGFSPPLLIEGPYSFWGWVVLILACLGTGYLEEIYFRYYLLTKTESLIPSPALRVVFSVLLFAVSHIHDGPWGVINAALAGLFLSALFLRYRSLHGIALAHAGYNFFVYAMGAVG